MSYTTYTHTPPTGWYRMKGAGPSEPPFYSNGVRFYDMMSRPPRPIPYATYQPYERIEQPEGYEVPT